MVELFPVFLNIFLSSGDDLRRASYFSFTFIVLWIFMRHEIYMQAVSLVKRFFASLWN